MPVTSAKVELPKLTKVHPIAPNLGFFRGRVSNGKNAMDPVVKSCTFGLDCMRGSTTKTKTTFHVFIH